MLREIMLVDDDRDDTFIHRRIVERAKVTNSITEFSSVDDAIAHLRKGARPDLVFLDINMPKKSGWDFLAEFAALPAAARAGVVVAILTSSNDQQDVARGAKGPAAAYLLKPLNEPTLLRLLSEHFPQTNSPR